MEVVLLIVGIIFFLLIFTIWSIWWVRRGLFRLKDAFVVQVLSHIESKVKVLPRVQQIVEYDKILGKILEELGYVGSTAEKLRQYGKKHTVPESVWHAHQERDKMTREGYEPPHAEVDRHVAALEREVFRILTKGVRRKSEKA